MQLHWRSALVAAPRDNMTGPLPYCGRRCIIARWNESRGCANVVVAGRSFQEIRGCDRRYFGDPLDDARPKQRLLLATTVTRLAPFHNPRSFVRALHIRNAWHNVALAVLSNWHRLKSRIVNI